MSTFTVNFSTIHNKWPYIWPFKRQTPGEKMQWGNTKFVMNKTNDNYDFIVVYDEPHKPISSCIPKSRRILFVSEPPSIKEYTPNYLNQFGIIFTPQKIEGLSDDIHQIIGQLSLPWHYGVKHSNKRRDYKTYDSLKATQPPEKINEVSTMVSNKTMNDHHRQRIKTTQFLKEKLGDKFHLLGRGHNEVDDKAEGIDPYAFHLVCENNDVPHFWTEKMADCYLGWAFPLFSGCANIGEYFPKDSFIQVDLSKPEETLETISKLLSSPEFYAERLSAIEEARNLVLDKYNLFAVIDNTLKQLKADTSQTLETPITLMPQTEQKSIPIRAINKVARRLKNLPFLLPIYFKIINANPSFFTDYYDRLGEKTLKQGYYSQRGQDWFIDQRIFAGKTNGVFLDVGANDPKDLSNTLYFEEKGWKGLAFEPQERFRNKWKTARKTECLPHLLGANDDEEVSFIEYDTDDWQNALSGVQGFAIEQANTLKDTPKTIKTLKKHRLDKILKEKNITNIDFMSLDVEGFEMEVLKGLDLSEINIEVIVVENDRSHLGDLELRRYIKSQGYRHIARLSGDDIFQKTKGK